MNNQYIYRAFFDDLVKLPKEELIELIKQEHKFDTENNPAQVILNELIYSGIHFTDVLDYLGKKIPGESRKDKKIRNLLCEFISAVMENDLYFRHNGNFIRNPMGYERL